MIEETYEQSYNHNYMIFRAKERKYTGFCERIIQENEISGLLPCQFQILDGELFFYYEISGKRTLAQLFQKRKIGGAEMRCLLSSLRDLQRESERYLLDFRKYILLPEYLYADFDIKHLYAAYYPDYEEDGMLEELGGFFVERADYQEAEAVELAYSFQQKIMEENVNLDFIADELLKEKKNEVIGVYGEEEPVKEEAHPCPDEGTTHEDSMAGERSLPEERPYVAPVRKERRGLEELVRMLEIRGIWPKLSFFRKKEKENRERRKREGKKREGRKKDRPVYEMELEYEDEREAVPFFRPPAASEETRFFPYEEEKEIRRLVYQGRGDAPDFALEVFPYIIGKGEKGIDGRLKDPAVSRIHCQLDFLDDAYYITDLNSTNGTLLNGERLPPNSRTRLSIGDRLQFAGEKYLFQ